MIGRKKLRKIREELRQRFERAGGDLQKSLDRLVRKAEGLPVPNRREIETLLMVRHALARTRPAHKRKPPRRAASKR
jgi:hypothetical protein